MSKQTLSGNKARAALLAGVEAVANPVKVTLGPRGRNVLLDRGQYCYATRDGVTVAKECASLPDKFENMGAQYAREVADADVSTAGDGTTTATVLFQAIVREGFKLIDAGAEPLAVAQGLEAATDACAAAIEKMIIKSTPELVRQAGIISAHGDVELGTIIADATIKVGVNGAVQLRESRDNETTVEHTDGYSFDRGWRTNHNVGDLGGRKVSLKNPLVLISERAIVGSGFNPNGQLMEGDGIGSLLVAVAKERRPLLVVAEEVVGDALSVLLLNCNNGQIAGGACVVKLPGIGEQRAAEIEDLRIACGAPRIHRQNSDRKDDQLSSFRAEDLGWCDEAIISADKTVLINGGGLQATINSRVKTLITQSQEAENPWIKAMLDARIARLTGGVAVLRVGAHSEPVLNERKARAEDAIHTCRWALSDGIVPGGGVALLNAFGLRMEAPDESDWCKGWNLLMNAITEPARQIIRNTGHKRADEIVDKILKTEGPSDYGYDAAQGRLCNLYEYGIIDSAKAVLTALRKASSVGALLLTSECLVTDIPEPPQPAPMMPPAFRG
jgi:chaperonin GroEL